MTDRQALVEAGANRLTAVGFHANDPTDAAATVVDAILADHYIMPKDEWKAMLAAFADLLEGAEDMRPYVSNYFAEKWGHDEYLERAKTFPLPQEDSDES